MYLYVLYKNIYNKDNRIFNLHPAFCTSLPPSVVLFFFLILSCLCLAAKILREGCVFLAV